MRSFSDDRLFVSICDFRPGMRAFAILDNSAHTDFTEILEHFKKLNAKGMGELTANLYADDPMVDNLFSYCAAASAVRTRSASSGSMPR